VGWGLCEVQGATQRSTWERAKIKSWNASLGFSEKEGLVSMPGLHKKEAVYTFSCFFVNILLCRNTPCIWLL
jgi:hypothetical protein